MFIVDLLITSKASNNPNVHQWVSGYISILYLHTWNMHSNYKEATIVTCNNVDSY